MKLKRVLNTDLGSNFIVFLGFLALSIIMTLPLIFNLNSIVESSESYYIIWSFWWIKESLIELQTNPLFTDYLFYPEGINLIFYPLTLLHSLSSIPLQLISNTVVSFNLVFILSFVVTGMSMYLLVNYLTKNKTAAFISGIIFAFCPFRFAQSAPHMHMLSTEFVPLYVLFLIKTVKEEKLINPILTSVFLFLLTLGDFHYTAYSAIFTGIFLLYLLFIKPKIILNKGSLKKLAVMSVTFLVLLSPLIPSILKEYSSKNADKPLDPNVVLSADIFSFLTPAQSHPVFGKITENMHSKFTGNKREHTVFIGYTVLALSLCSIFKIRNKDTKFWLIVALIFFVLSLGPALHIMGRFAFPSPFKLGSLADKVGLETSPLGKELIDHFIGIPLPYLFLRLFIPFFNITRAPVRFSIMMMFSLAILSGYVISKIKNKWIILLIGLLIIFEFLALPIKVMDSSIPDFYHQLSEDEEVYAIVEAPIYHNGTYAYKYYQIYHEKKIIGGGWTRASPEAKQIIKELPLLGELSAPSTAAEKVHNRILNKIIETNPEAEEIIKKYIEEGGGIYSENKTEASAEPSKEDVKKLKELNVRLIVLHKDLLDRNNFERIDELLKSLLDDPNYFYEDDEIVVYKI